MTLKELARQRLEYLVNEKGLSVNVLHDFDKGVINYSERMNGYGILYWLTEDNECPQEWIDKVKEIEDNGKRVIYHATYERTTMGNMLDLYYVNNEDLEDEFAEEDFRNGYCYAYVYNTSCPELSEYGGIGFEVSGGGIVRTA